MNEVEKKLNSIQEKIGTLIDICKDNKQAIDELSNLNNELTETKDLNKKYENDHISLLSDYAKSVKNQAFKDNSMGIEEKPHRTFEEIVEDVLSKGGNKNT